MSLWTTKSIEELLDRYNKTGVMPKDNPFFKRKVNYLKAGIIYKYTKEEIEEKIKCKVNIIHFAENHAKVLTDEGVRLVKLRPYQRNVLLQFYYYPLNVWLASRQIGKCVSFDTKIKVKEGNKYKDIEIYKLYYKNLPKELSFMQKMSFMFEKFMFDILLKLRS